MTPGRRRSETSDQDPARRAWGLMCDLVLDNERRREVSDALGLTFGRIRALRRIARSPMTMGELATNLGIDAPYATLVVDELERQGLVERRPHPTDRRVKVVRTTTAGTAAAERAGQISDRPPTSLTSLPGPDLEALARILESAAPPITGPEADEPLTSTDAANGAGTTRLPGRAI
jgi:DNA-binding MarR family transcriptional regulator